MVINDDPLGIAVITIALIFFLSLGIFLMKKPEIFVSTLGWFLRRRVTYGRLTNNQVEKMILPGTKEMYNNNMKEFITEAENDPEKFTKMIDYVRNFGTLIVVMIVGTLFISAVLTLLVIISPYGSICFTSQSGCP